MKFVATFYVVEQIGMLGTDDTDDKVLFEVAFEAKDKDEAKEHCAKLNVRVVELATNDDGDAYEAEDIHFEVQTADEYIAHLERAHKDLE